MAETQTVKAMRVTNPELQAMAKIDEILAPMEDTPRQRVVAWIISSYVGGKFRMMVGGELEANGQ